MDAMQEYIDLFTKYELVLELHESGLTNRQVAYASKYSIPQVKRVLAYYRKGQNKTLTEAHEASYPILYAWAIHHAGNQNIEPAELDLKKRGEIKMSRRKSSEAARTYRKIIYLHDRGLSNNEIMEVLGVGHSTVKDTVNMYSHAKNSDWNFFVNCRWGKVTMIEETIKASGKIDEYLQFTNPPAEPADDKSCRITMCFSPEIYDYIKTMSRMKGMTIAAFTESVFRKSMDSNADLYAMALKFRGELV